MAKLCSIAAVLVLCACTAHARVWYVAADGAGTGTGWGDALPGVGAALTAATSGDEVWVKGATYEERISLKEGVSLFGGFAGDEDSREHRDCAANPTVIDATGTNQSAVLGSEGATLDGFTIRGGKALRGGGVYFGGVSSATLANCTITGNSADENGGGVYCSSSLALSDCTIMGNTARAGGGVYCSYSSPVLTNCTIAQNTGRLAGAGVYCWHSSPALTNCTITSNTTHYDGGGLFCRDSSPALAYCEITDNSAELGGGLYCWYSSPALTHCSITANTATKNGGGVHCYVSSPAMSRCTVAGNAANRGGGGVSCLYSSPTLSGCTIAGNTAPDEGGGVSCDLSSSPTLTNCTIAENTVTSRGGGLYCGELTSEPANGATTVNADAGIIGSSTAPTLINCTLTGNAAFTGSGVYCSASSPNLWNCILYNRGEEIIAADAGQPFLGYCCVQGGWPGESNIDGDPLFVSLVDGDYRLRSGSACIDRATCAGAPAVDLDGRPRPSNVDCLTEPDRSCWDIGAYEAPREYEQGPANHVPTRWFVRADGPENGNGTDWTTAFRTITQALDVSGTSGEIWVRQGTYQEAILLEPRVSLYGGFAGTEAVREARSWTNNETVIDGAAANRTTVRGAWGATLDGFCITGGRAVKGGGVYFDGISSATLANCTITGNTSIGDELDGGGGGVYCINSAPTLENCRITGNDATGDPLSARGGAIYCRNSSPTLANCTVTGNRADSSGGGFYCSHSSPTLASCTITANSAEGGGGVGCYEYSSPALANCTISGNSSRFGGGMSCWYYSSPALTNCRITTNTTVGNGSGVYCVLSSPTLANCTITDNTTTDASATVYSWSSFPSLTNCILWNEGPELEGTGWTCTYSCVEGDATGEGNIAPAAPSWGDDLRLLPGSPCIDAGDPATLYADGCRPPGLGTARNDMGAFGGPGNCAWLAPVETPTATPTDTPVDTPTVTAPPEDSPTPTPVDTDTPQPTVDPRADVNRDGWVNHEDLLIFLEHWHRSGEQ